MRGKFALLACFIVLFGLCGGAWGNYCRISALSSAPTPPNPVTVSGKVTSVSPLRLNDGSGDVQVSGITGSLGDFIVVQGDWDGSILTIAQSPGKAVMYLPFPMVYMPASSLMMGNSGAADDLTCGNPNESPQHVVTVSGFWMGKFEVTRGDFQKFIAAGGYSNAAYWSTDGWNWKTANSRTQPDYWTASQIWLTVPFTQADDYPVVGVTYYEAEAFCNWAGCHLPTEAQWEKAARSASASYLTYPWGDVLDAARCNCATDALYPGPQTCPVGSYTSGASPNFCQDMGGNVWEWCKDWYADDYYWQTPVSGWSDPQGPTTGSYRVLRGGGWDNIAYGARCAYRNYSDPRSTWYSIGFRLAR